MKSRLASAALVLAALALSLTACSGNGGDDPSTTATGGQSFTVGVATYLDHPSLALIRQGLEDYLTEQGVQVTYKDENAQADSSIVATIATTFAADDSLDAIVAITTPVAQAIVAQVSDVPVVYTGVTNPVDAGLMTELEGPSGTNVTGVSDLNPDANMVALIQEIIPDCDTIGVLWSSSEANSEFQVHTWEDQAAPLGITIQNTAISNSNEIATGVQSLAGVDAILIPTDNTVVAGISYVIDFGVQNQIPVFTADAESVELGSIATQGLSYYEQGRETGQILYQILVEGKDPGTIPGVVTRKQALTVNLAAAAAMGVTIPDSLLEGATIVG